ncbi:hypothetical protein F4604DRAFT_1688997 [Suillus subluteus]|nr:hypothetical protein F4604DRAFT_1688997 [Suillus subluteus]
MDRPAGPDAHIMAAGPFLQTVRGHWPTQPDVRSKPAGPFPQAATVGWPCRPTPCHIMQRQAGLLWQKPAAQRPATPYSLHDQAYPHVPSDSSPPIAKRRSLSCESVIADLTLSPGLILNTADSAVHPLPSNWPFPTELALKILEDMLPQDLQSIVQVSCFFRELVAPIYLRSLGLQFDDESLHVTTQACFFLLLYRHTALFRAPRYLRCDLFDADDCHLEALQNFVKSLEGTQALFISIVKDGEMLGDFAPLFQTIQHSGCRSLRFSDREASCLAYPPPILPDVIAIENPTSRRNFHIFYADSPIFFSRSVVALTLTALQNPSLTDLSLTRTSLSALQWTVIMHDINLTQLKFLSIDCKCPTVALVDFLTWHEVHQLWLHSIDDGTGQPCPPLDMDIPRIPMHSLRTLSGPHWYLVSLLNKIHIPQCIQTLDLQLDATFLESTPNYLSAILDITQQFVAIDSLQLNFYDGSLISENFDVTLDVDNQTIPAKKLTIYLPHWYKYSDQHPLFHCSPWLQVFQHVENVCLRPGYMSLSERQELEVAFCHPKHPYNLDIGHYI